MRRFAILLVATILGLGLAACASVAPPEVRQALAPTGALRVALIEGAPANMLRGTAGPTRGVGYELGRELARRLGVPFEAVPYPSVGALVEAGRTGAWDVSFNGITPERAAFLDATQPHLRIEFGFLVPAQARITTAAGVDRPGLRVTFPRGGAIEPALRGALHQAMLVPAAGLPGTLTLLKSGDADVIASNKPNLAELARQLPGARILEGSFGAETQALLVPKGRGEAALRYADDFVADAKRNGKVQAAIERAGMRGTSVAP